MLSGFSLPALGVLMLVLFGVFYWLAIFATIRAILAFVGTILIGSAGFVGNALGAAARWLVTLGGTLTSWAFGTSVLAAVTIVVLVVFIHDLHPRNSAGKRTGWAGILLAALLIGGVTGIPALNNVPSAVRTGVQNAQNIGG